METINEIVEKIRPYKMHTPLEYEKLIYWTARLEASQTKRIAYEVLDNHLEKHYKLKPNFQMRLSI